VEVARDFFPPIRGRTPKRGGRKWKEDETWKINIENVSAKTSWQDLKDFFSEFGEVSFVEVSFFTQISF
jgi:RNA recognition motif-containing protein